MLSNLTNAQQKVFNLYRNHIAHFGHTPSYPEAGRKLNLSPSVIHYHVKQLEKMGYLAKSDRGRSVQLVGSNDTQTIPLLGLVAGGEPITIFEECDEYLDVPISMLRGGGNFYALKVRGDSMKNAGIVDGDTVVIRKQENIENGGIAVVAIGEIPFESATLKRVFKNPKSVVLQPENEDFEAIVTSDASVRGKLVGVLRNY